jgi:hypothetical protein
VVRDVNRAEASRDEQDGEGVYISIRTDINAVGLHLPHAVLEKLAKSIAGLEKEG